MAAIDEAAPEALLSFPVLVEVHARGILIEARGHLVLGLLDGLAVHMVDLVANGIIFPTARSTGERIVVHGELERRQRLTEGLRRNALV